MTPAETPSPDDLPSTPPWFRFGKQVFPPTRLTCVNDAGVTLNGALASLLFDDLRADLQGEAAGLSMVVGSAVELPAEVLSNDVFVGYIADVRGFCSKTKGCRGIVTVQLGAATHTQTFAYDEEFNDSWFAQMFSFERRPNKDSGQPVIPLPPLTINIMLSAQRRTLEDSIIISLDSVDLSADRN